MGWINLSPLTAAFGGSGTEARSGNFGLTKCTCLVISGFPPNQKSTDVPFLRRLDAGVTFEVRPPPRGPGRPGIGIVRGTNARLGPGGRQTML
jgi:hypothetical protein